MRRILTVLIMLVAFEGMLAAQSSKFDSDLSRRNRDFKNGNSGKSKDEDKGKDKDKDNGKVRVIIQTDGDPDASGATGHVTKNGGKVLGKFSGFPGFVAEIPLAALENASSHSRIKRVSTDENMENQAVNTDNVSLSTVDVNRLVSGAPQAWSKYNVDGAGIGVAVIDSGVTNSADVSTKLDVDFTGTGGTKDQYGHGTHVAGIIAGSGALSNYKYIGDAPGVNLVNLRVLDGNGNGYVSSVISAIDWAIQNRNAIGKDGKPVNIRVINLSLGHMPYESAATDPLTLACRRAVMAGMVVVAAAGNYGKGSNGQTIYGGITSPGTEPTVITVGAVSTYDTVGRYDDVAASYSSRGPSIDHLMKPDIAAPGTKIVAPMAAGNKLAQTYPQLVYNSYYMRMSGTSMAAPVVSAAAALMLQKNPGLTPNTVKAILMFTAERRGNSSALALGASEVNTLGAMNLTSNINPSAPANGYWLLNNGQNLTYGDDINGYRAVWGGTIVWDEGQYSGNSMNYNRKSWATTIVWGDTIVWEELAAVYGSTIVWETDVNALNVAIGGQTITWDTVCALSADEIDAEW